MSCLSQPCATPNQQFADRAIERQAQLTKPPQALGDLETLAIRLAALQAREKPQVERVHISIFAGDHGVVAEGVSAFPQAVTQQMVANFLHGGAAISVLARSLQAQLEIIDTGIIEALPAQAGLIIQRAGAGTANSAQIVAMSEEQLQTALQAGIDAAERAHAQQAELFIGGEMGIGNTTPATVLYCALLNLSPQTMTGAGTGLDAKGIAHKTQVIEQILERHAACGTDALAWLRSAGGFEIAALTGAYLRAGQLGIPILLDGFITTAAALVALKLQPSLKDWLFLSHASAERGHKQAIASLGLRPLLDLNLRLGEGSGAAIAVSILRQACVLHNEMATFAEAAVAGKVR
jgi:nicotinate-nucleotide--dimethylbenzimidazole phosphoribosyltransferase